MSNSKRAAVLTGQTTKARQVSNLAETCKNVFMDIPEKYKQILIKELAILAMADRQMNMAKQSQLQVLERLQKLSKQITSEGKV